MHGAADKIDDMAAGMRYAGSDASSDGFLLSTQRA